MFVFDVTKQSEKLKNFVTDNQIKAQFSADIPANTEAFAVVISDKSLIFHRDGLSRAIIYSFFKNCQWLTSDYVYSLQGYKDILMKVFCHNLKVLLFSQTIKSWNTHYWTHLFLCKDRGLMPRLTAVIKLFIFRKTTAETNECDSESSSQSFHRASQQNRFVCWWRQTNNSSRSNIYISSRLSRIRTDREAQGKQRDPGKHTGPWGGEFQCYFWEDRGTLGKNRARGGEFLFYFGHRWEVDKINKQRKERDPSIPSSLLLRSAVCFLQPILQLIKNLLWPSWLQFLYLRASDVHQHTLNRSRVATLL